MRLYYKDVAPILYNKGILIDNPTEIQNYGKSRSRRFWDGRRLRKDIEANTKTLFDEDGQRYVECLKGMGSEKEKQQ